LTIRNKQWQDFSSRQRSRDRLAKEFSNHATVQRLLALAAEYEQQIR